MFHKRYLVLVLIVIFIFPACAKKEVTPVKEEIEKSVEEVTPPLEEQKPEEAPVEVKEEPEEIVLEDVFFDFDKYEIKDEYKKVLEKNAEILLAHPEIKLLVEGHCDERGTIEYNLALGEKRAKAVIDFYIAYGISPDRLSMISYGEEKPFDPGHNEEAWAKNRRAHMVIQK